MRKTITSGLVFLLFVAFVAAPAMAGKPADVITKSNGFPSGPHFNMIIHGKDTSVFSCDSSTVGGNSIFVPEYTTDNLNGDSPGEVSIQYIQNRKASLIDLLVLDSCAIDDGLARVQLPDKVMLEDGSTQPTDGFWVYAKITGKPNNGPEPDTASKIILYPNQIIDACNDGGDPDFGDYTSCEEGGDLALGVIWNNVYVPNPYTGDFVRFDPATTGGKGKSMGKDITRLFVYVGWVVSETLDTNVNTTGIPDGIIDWQDVTADYTGDGSITADDVEPWLQAQAALGTPLAWYFPPEANTWMHDIADLVITEQGLTNMGTKTLQVRFYPRSTTVFQ